MYYLSDLISIWIAWNGRGSPLEIDQLYCLLEKKNKQQGQNIFELAIEFEGSSHENQIKILKSLIHKIDALFVVHEF